LNVLVVNVHPFVLWSALENQARSLLGVCLEVALTVCATVQVLVKELPVVALIALLLIIIKVLVLTALNTLFSNRKRFFNWTFSVQWVLGLFINLLLNVRVGFCAGPIGILQVCEKQFIFTVVCGLVEKCSNWTSSTTLLSQ
jgi:hypothetical protein